MNSQKKISTIKDRTRLVSIVIFCLPLCSMQENIDFIPHWFFIVYEKLKANNIALAKALSKEKQESQRLFSQNLALNSEIQDLGVACNVRNVSIILLRTLSESQQNFENYVVADMVYNNQNNIRGQSKNLTFSSLNNDNSIFIHNWIS